MPPVAIHSSVALDSVWRGVLGRHIFFGSHTPNWSVQDETTFLVYAARYRWTDALEADHVGTKELQKELLLYTAHRGLNKAIMVAMVAATKVRLEQERAQTPNLFDWPAWTMRWFLNPWWDGQTAQLPPGAPLHMPNLQVFDDLGKTDVQPLVVWQAMSDSEKDMCFAAARRAAQATQRQQQGGVTVLRPNGLPTRRMEFSLPTALGNPPM